MRVSCQPCQNINTENIKLNNIYASILGGLELVEKNIAGIIQRFNRCSNNLCHVKDVSEYFFEVPGKKLRPALVMLSASAAKPGRLSNEELYNCGVFATAMELIHSASLLHDDVIDGHTFRRGRQSVSKRFSTHTAVLFGDMVYAEAFKQLSKLRVNSGGLKNRIFTEVSEISGKMCMGELESINSAKSFSESRYKSVIEKKTALLMEVSCKLPAVMMGGNSKTVNALKNFGYSIGMLYQVIDDYIDDDINVPGLSFIGYADMLVQRAKKTLSVVESSIYTQKMSELVDCINNV